MVSLLSNLRDDFYAWLRFGRVILTQSGFIDTKRDGGYTCPDKIMLLIWQINLKWYHNIIPFMRIEMLHTI